MIRVITNHVSSSEYSNREFNTSKEAEDYIELKSESLADRGWSQSEDPTSTSKRGSIKCKLDDRILIIEWLEVK